MPLYTCKTCSFTSKLKSDFTRHQNTKKHKKNILLHKNLCSMENPMSQNEPKMSQNEPINEPVKGELYHCQHCGKEYKSKANMRRHELHRCQSNSKRLIGLLNMQQEMLKNAEKEKKILYKQIEKLIDKAGNTTINNTQNIILNNYGNEDLSHITDNLKVELLKIPYGAIPKMIQQIHFNDDKPENKNIALINKKENKIKVFSGNKWIYKNKDETINDLVDGKYFILDSYYEDNIKNVNVDIQNTYEKFREYYDENDKMFIDNLKEECELVLLNNR
jgi:hypothetical protein